METLSSCSPFPSSKSKRLVNTHYISDTISAFIANHRQGKLEMCKIVLYNCIILYNCLYRSLFHFSNILIIPIYTKVGFGKAGFIDGCDPKLWAPHIFPGIHIPQPLNFAPARNNALWNLFEISLLTIYFGLVNHKTNKAK